MKLHLLRVCTLGLAVGVCATVLAQSDIPVEYLRPLNNSVSVGVHVMNHGINVKFGNLGTIPYTATIVSPTNTTDSRVYNNGSVTIDAIRSEEIASTADDGTVTYLPVVNGRYRPTLTTTVTNDDGSTTDTTVTVGDKLAYVAGQTREWSYTSPSQVQNGQIAMSDYASSTLGGQTTGKGGSSAGVELEISHTFGKIGERLEWGLGFSFGLGDINVKSSGTVPVTLHTTTDYYSLQGAAAPDAPYTASSYVDFVGPDDGVTYSGGQETTTPLAQFPSANSGLETTSTGTAVVKGNWQIKGAYYLMHLGPTLRFTISPRFALSGSFGPALALAGTRYKLDETLVVAADNSQIRITQETLNERKLVGGYYGEFNGEFWVTSRTGFYAGVSYEKLSSYKQEAFSGRTATVDLGSGAGFRLGMITRF